MPPLRSLSLLMALAVPGVAGWFGGRWAHEGLRPAERTGARAVLPAGMREPVVAAGSPEGLWMARARKAEPRDFAALMEELDGAFPKQTHYQARGPAVQWLLGLWVQQDAEGAAAYVAERKDDMLGSHFGLVLGSVAPGKVAAIMSGPHGQSLGVYFASAVARAQSAADPREYLRRSGAPDGEPPRDWARALGALAAEDPLATAALWSQQKTKDDGKALFALARAWVQRDPAAARQWVEGLTDPAEQHLARHAWLVALARKDLNAARHALTEMNGGEWVPENAGSRVRDARKEIAVALARVDLAASLTLLATLPPDTTSFHGADPKTTVRSAIVEALAPSLPGEPVALLVALRTLRASAGSEGEGGAFGSLETDLILAKIGPQGEAAAREAVRLLLSAPPADGSPNARSALLAWSAQQDPERTMDFIASLPEAQRAVLGVAAFEDMGWANPGQLHAVAGRIPPDAWTTLMGRQLGRIPETAHSTMSALPVNAETDRARDGFARVWAMRDPQAAANWTETLSAESGAVPAAQGTAEAWARYDDAAASAWAAALPPGPLRDGAATGLAKAIAPTDPEAAWHWAASISNNESSLAAYENVAREWGSEAPENFREAYSAALDAGGVTGSDKHERLRRLGDPARSKDVSAP